MWFSIGDRGGLLVVMSLAVLGGCGGPADGLAREPISGTVSLDGKPLANGYITFDPTAGEPTQSGGVITDGSFSVPREQGPVPGQYKVSIYSGSKEAVLATQEAKTGMPGHVPNQPRESIPAKYNAQSTLTAAVKAGEKNHFEFALEKK